MVKCKIITGSRDMLSVINSSALVGIEGKIIKVEVDVSNGLPCFDLVGLPDAAVRESKERVRTAIRNSGFEYPLQRITINLAPADLRKVGPGYDLPIALAILGAIGEINLDGFNNSIFIGELSLDGEVRPINGVLPMGLEVRKTGFMNYFVPSDNSEEAGLVKDINVFPVRSLKQIVEHIKGEKTIKSTKVDIKKILGANRNQLDFKDVKGQYIAKKALEISASGGHNVLLIGSPGAGKTMLAKRLPSILPPLSLEEAIEITKVYSTLGQVEKDNPLISTRPFRSPHHNISSAALIGGGRVPIPGEVSLSNHGILFLDEMPEFPRDALEALRQPLEDGVVSVSRINGAYTYPANITLIASMNPCPCGYYGDREKECTCTPPMVHRYMNRISGPLLDRIDMHVHVPRLKYDDLVTEKDEESSLTIQSRVIKAREIQRERFKGRNISCNSEMGSKEIKEFCFLDKAGAMLMKSAFNKLNLSGRGYNRLLKVARTIADLSASKNIEVSHLAEAIQYRRNDQNLV